MNLIQRLVIEPFDTWCQRFIQFWPNLLTAFLLVVFGVVFAWLANVIIFRTLRALKVDVLSERVGFQEILARSGVRTPLSRLVARTGRWTLLIVFSIIAFQTLRIPTLERLIERFFLYLPQVFLAAVILLVGYLLGNFLSRALLIAAVNAGNRHAGAIGRFSKFTVLAVASTMSLEQLGVGKETVLLAFGILFGGVVFALALAFGLGGRDTARRYLKEKMKNEKESDDIDYL
jgi:hypothetical protein